MMEKTKQKEIALLESLEQFINDFLGKHYNLKLKVPVEWNGRIQKCLARVLYDYDPSKGKNVPIKIDISKQLMFANKKTLSGVALHEAIHYALIVKDLPFKDGEAYFENELNKHGLGYTSNFSQSNQHYHTFSNVPVKRYIITCSQCSKIVVKSAGKKQSSYAYYVSKCCRKPLKDWGRQDILAGQKYFKN